MGGKAQAEDQNTLIRVDVEVHLPASMLTKTAAWERSGDDGPMKAVFRVGVILAEQLRLGPPAR